MADDWQDKTEEPTSKKLADARRKGQVAKSQDLNGAGVLLAGMMILGFTGRWMYARLEQLTVETLSYLTRPFDSYEGAIELFNWGVRELFILGMPIFGGLSLAAFLINVAQVQFLFSTEPMKPKWKNINIFDPSVYKKFFSLQAIMRLVFGLSKLTVIGVVCYLVIKRSLPELTHLMHGSGMDIFLFLAYQGFLIGIIIALILIFLGVAEFVYQKWKFQQDMKMTKQEVKDERRQMEGDVHLKGKMRSMMQSFASSRMKDNVPHADVIIANPVHYAIAVKYDADSMPAPVCIAKGARKMALSIREIAEEHGVPVVENPPLARGLYKVVEVGDLIPQEFYHSIAEVLAYVYRLNASMESKQSGGKSPPQMTTR